ncbi:MAG: LysM peptidoglycan-binding domain-containing protein [Planctomycetota bacterium]
MGNFEKLGILVIIVLVVVILVLAVWGMGVPPDPQDGDLAISATAERAAANGGDASKEGPRTVRIPAKGSGGGEDWWVEQEPAREPAPKDESASNEPNPDLKRAPAAPAADLEHKVVKGDSLWEIAEKYYGNGAYVKAIEKANPGLNSGSLQIDQTIRIPHPDKVLATRSAPRREASGRETGREASTDRKTYTVKKGDNLTGIARRTMGDGNRWRELYEANRDAIGSDPGALKQGMELVIP